ncbi:MAG TPA: ABC transporter ATP-binding protein [Bdellovibrionota bacterium]|jgi:phospholipid/cholesterol/gamma-HCH transport system ATP-binding protein|nr:ABC transporter ATP-binding protein [Bdellovibrionota bacterium]
MNSVISFKNVRKKFPSDERAVLDDFNLEIEAGELHVLIGYSGTGKSVSLKHILGLMSPDAGIVEVLGNDWEKLNDVEARDLRTKFGMLFQSAALFDSLTVFENVAFPMREHRRDWSEDQIRKRVEELLGLVGLETARDKMPVDISGGMKKRVGFARAIALQPEILLFDEPTTGLDPVTSDLIDQLIRDLTKKIGATAFVISHDMHAALRIADRVSMLYRGKIIETASPKEFIKTQNPHVRHFLTSAGVLESRGIVDEIT